MSVLAPVANHLWQSTACAALVALAALGFRRHGAAVRHALWLAASIKFLVPFAALVALGGALGIRPPAAADSLRRDVTIVIADPGGAFAMPPLDLLAPASAAASSSPAAWLPVVLTIWAAGSIVILTVWIVRWRRVAAIARAGAPIEDGRDLAALRAIERRTGRKRPIALVSSDAALEPGVFGIVRPVLVWPASIARHLGDDQIATILSHEVAHVRRLDNLAAAMHMVVEALFWFHPVVWWIGARQIEERERACDEAVLRSGGEPEVYAETILKACRLYLESPLACVAGVTGSDLTRRIERIMTSGRPRTLSPWRKALLAAGGVAAIAAPIAAGAAAPPPRRIEHREIMTALRVRPRLTRQTAPPSAAAASPRFEVASVKPNTSGGGPVRIQTSPGGRFTAINVTLKNLVQFAYRLQSFQVSGGPDWINAARFDIVAKGVDGDLFGADQSGQPSPAQLMLRALLADRFKLVVRNESRDLPMYALIVARADGRLGSDLRRSTLQCGAPPADRQAIDKSKPAERGDPSCGIRLGLGTMTMGGATLAQLASTLSGVLDRCVVDRTALDGLFDASLKWTPDQSTPGLAVKAGFAPAGLVDPNGASIFTAVQEQLGLKLDSQKGPVALLIIDRAERPTEN